jgi:hypothetical protein
MVAVMVGALLFLVGVGWTVLESAACEYERSGGGVVVALLGLLYVGGGIIEIIVRGIG